MGLLAGVPSGRPLPPWQRPQWCLGVGLTVGELALSLAAPRCFPGDKPPPVRVAYPMLPPCHHYSATMSGVQARVCAHMAADFFVRVAAGAQGFAVAEEENWARGPRAVQLLRTVHPLFERCCPGTPEPPGLRIAVAFAQCSEQNPAYVTIRDRQDLSIVVHGQRVLHVHKPAHDGDHWTMVLAEMFTDIERIWADPAEAAPDPAAPHSDSDTDSDSDDDSTSSASRRQALALRQSTMERNRLRLTKVDVTVSDSILDYNPRGFPGRLVAVVGSVRVQCLVVMLSEELRTEVSASGVSFFLDSGHFRKDLADYDALEGEQSLFAKAALLHPPDGAPLCPLEGVRTTLPLLGFVRVAATGRPFTVVVTTITPFVDYVPHLRGRGGRQRRRRRADEELQLQAEDDTQKPKPCVVELGQIDLRCKFCGDSYTLFWDTISHLLAGDESALRERPLLELYAELGVVPPPPPLPPPPQAAADAGAEALRRFAAATERAVQAALHSELSQEEGGAPAFSAPPAAWHGVGPVVHEEHYGEHAGTGGPQVDDVPDPGLGQEESTDLGLSAPFSRGSSSSPSARASAHSPPQAAGRGQDHECGAAAAAAPDQTGSSMQHRHADPSMQSVSMASVGIASMGMVSALDAPSARDAPTMGRVGSFQSLRSYPAGDGEGRDPEWLSQHVVVHPAPAPAAVLVCPATPAAPGGEEQESMQPVRLDDEPAPMPPPPPPAAPAPQPQQPLPSERSSEYDILWGGPRREQTTARVLVRGPLSRYVLDDYLTAESGGKGDIESEAALPRGFPTPTFELTVRESSLSLALFGGKDFAVHLSTAAVASRLRKYENDRRELGDAAPKPKVYSSTRLSAQQLALAADGVWLTYDTFNSHGHLWRLHCGAHDLRVYDRIRTSSRHMLLMPLCDVAQDADMVNFLFHAVAPAGAAQPEHRLSISLAPLRVNLDQDAVDLVRSFFSSPAAAAASPPSSVGSPSGPTPVPPPPAAAPAADRGCGEDAPAAPPAAFIVSGPNSAVITGGAPAGAAEDRIYFQHVKVSRLSVKVDYAPKGVHVPDFLEGQSQLADLLWLIPVEDMNVELHPAEVGGCWSDALAGRLLELWWQHVRLQDLISGVPVLRSVARVGDGALNVFLQPCRDISVGRNPLQSVPHTLFDLARRMVVETFHLTEQAARIGSGIADIGVQVLRPARAVPALEAAFTAPSCYHALAATSVLRPSEGTVRALLRCLTLGVLRPTRGLCRGWANLAQGTIATLDPARRAEFARLFKQRLAEGEAAGEGEASQAARPRALTPPAQMRPAAPPPLAPRR
eukprot:TRINITY_DN469_c0_g1_i1.p1 TRINITY_DN469_c0_g1~~TRINITY_DN469_c0_g1_i1.p1  ORF type:complete len:1426 (+),score=488.04 TRINITY_DN469_c0_g1_i1:358-4278(+)